MTYVTCRLYQGSKTKTPQELDKIVGQELVPQLMKSGGLLRYITLKTSDDRIGSFSAFEDQASAERAANIAKQWMSSTGVMSGLKQTVSYTGNVISSHRGGGDLRMGSVGIIAINQTSASDSNIEQALRESQSILQQQTGLARLTIVRLSQGEVGVFVSFTNADAVQRWKQDADAQRAHSGSPVQKVFPNAPQRTEVEVLNVYNG